MHLYTGDCFTMFACVYHYSKKYDNVFIFCLERNKEFVKQLYEKLNVNITIIPELEHKDCKLIYAAPESYIKRYMNVGNYDLIKTGSSFSEDRKIAPEWEKMKKENKEFLFWRFFYKQANLKYEIRYDYKNINRNFQKEKLFYDKIKLIYGTKYIFIHDHRNIYGNHTRNRLIKDLYLDEDIPVFHPNINYYSSDEKHKFFNLWSAELISNNILDYGLVLENAIKIDIVDSSFSCYCPYLNLEKVNKKIIRTNLNIVDYHKSFKNWEITNFI